MTSLAFPLNCPKILCWQENAIYIRIQIFPVFSKELTTLFTCVSIEHDCSHQPPTIFSSRTGDPSCAPQLIHFNGVCLCQVGAATRGEQEWKIFSRNILTNIPTTCGCCSKTSNKTRNYHLYHKFNIVTTTFPPSAEPSKWSEVCHQRK